MSGFLSGNRTARSSYEGVNNRGSRCLESQTTVRVQNSSLPPPGAQSLETSTGMGNHSILRVMYKYVAYAAPSALTPLQTR